MPKPDGPIVVIGSINMDLVCRVPRMPAPGETLIGQDFKSIPGGKGANQAVAAAKLVRNGRKVHIIGRVGEGAFGELLIRSLKAHGVHTEYVVVTEGVNSGVAMIMVDEAGENAIVVSRGANAKLTPDDLNESRELIESASVVLMQLEIPIETVRYAVAMCAKAGVLTILDPAPAPLDGMPRALYGVDLLTPNQSEAEILLGLPPAASKRHHHHLSDAKQIGTELLSRGAREVVLKLSSHGAMHVAADGEIDSVPGFKVKLVDTTAAGDAFNGALAVAIAEGKSRVDAVRFANAAGALCCQTFGAQPSLPTRAEVDELARRKM